MRNNQFNKDSESTGNSRKRIGKSKPLLNQNKKESDRKDKPSARFSDSGRFKAKRVLPKHKKVEHSDDGSIRLNRFLANAGVCSRREADDFIKAGVVKINGKVVSELGVKVMPTDSVHFHDQLIKSERKVYILLNKPKNTVTTANDPQGRLTVLDLVRNAGNERVYPVGRLDRNTMGVLLITNDGDLTIKLTHPKYEKKKIYHVTLDKPLEPEDFEKILLGISLEDGHINADALEYVENTSRKEVGIEIHSGRNRIVRRIFEHLGYKIEKLDRVYFAGLTKYNLPRGKWRFLTDAEVSALKIGSYE